MSGHKAQSGDLGVGSKAGNLNLTELRTVDPRGLQLFLGEGWTDKSLVVFTIPQNAAGFC